MPIFIVSSSILSAIGSIFDLMESYKFLNMAIPEGALYARFIDKLIAHLAIKTIVFIPSVIIRVVRNRKFKTPIIQMKWLTFVMVSLSALSGFILVFMMTAIR